MFPNFKREASFRKVLHEQSYRAVATHHVRSMWQSWSFQVVEQGCRAHSKGFTGTIHRQIQIEPSSHPRRLRDEMTLPHTARRVLVSSGLIVTN